MVYLTKSVPKMATAAAAAVNQYRSADVDIDPIAIDAAVAVHAANPDEAPARAANAAAQAGATGAVSTAVAAGVAAAADGWEFKTVQKTYQAAFDTFSSEQGKLPADVAEDVAKAVRRESSDYPAVEAAAAAAHAAYMSGKAPAEVDDTSNAAAGDGVDTAFINAAGSVDGAAHAATGPAVDDAGNATTGGAVEGADIAAIRGDTLNDAAIAAANAAGAATGAVEGPGRRSCAAITAARMATARGANQLSAVAAAVNVATSTDAGPSTNQRAERVAAAIADASSSFDSAVAPVGARGVDQPGGLTRDHKRTYQGLNTIMALDTFMAGLLLPTLTGKLEEEAASRREVAHVILQTMSFGVLLAATVFAGTLMLSTGGKYALSLRDLIGPIILSVMGLGLLLVTVGNSAYLALGLTSDHETSYLVWFYVSIVFGLLAPAYATMFVAITTTRRRPQHTGNTSSNIPGHG